MDSQWRTEPSQTDKRARVGTSQVHDGLHLWRPRAIAGRPDRAAAAKCSGPVTTGSRRETARPTQAAASPVLLSDTGVLAAEIALPSPYDADLPRADPEKSAHPRMLRLTNKTVGQERGCLSR